MKNPRGSIALLILLISSTWLSAAPDATTQSARPWLPPGIHADLNLEYIAGGGPQQSLDLFRAPDAVKPLALIVYIHGGGWMGGDKSPAPAGYFALHGYAVASINYRLSSAAKWPAQIQDCQAAIRWLRAHCNQYNLDPNRVGVCGHSAGGHLAALVGTAGGKNAFPPIGGNETQSDRVRAVCDWSGPTDLAQLEAQAHPDETSRTPDPNSPITHLLGGPVADNKTLAESANPIHFITKDTPPFLIVHGTADNIVPLGQSQLLVDALKRAGVKVFFFPLQGDGHSPNVGRPGFLDLHLSFFDRYVKGVNVEIKPMPGTGEPAK